MTVRYAIVGSGMMGQEHIRNIKLLDGAEIVAVADPDEGMRTAAAELAGPGTRAFADHGDLFSADIADAYVIVSPNHTHADIALDAIATGKPLLIEKPLCTTVADCTKVARAAEAAGVPVWVAMEYRYMPAIDHLIGAVGSGEIGGLKMLTIREHRFPFLAKVGGWNRFAENTGGTLVEKCCHFFDLMRLIIKAEPMRIYASGAQDVNHLDERHDGRVPDIVDNALVVVDFANGARAALDLCMFAEGAEFQERICAVGTTATMEARVPGPDRFAPDGARREAEIVLSPRATKIPVSRTVEIDETIRAAGDHHGSTYYQHLGFFDTVRTGRPPSVTLDDGLRAVAMGAAAEESIRTHLPVVLDV